MDKSSKCYGVILSLPSLRMIDTQLVAYLLVPVRQTKSCIRVSRKLACEEATHQQSGEETNDMYENQMTSSRTNATK